MKRQFTALLALSATLALAAALEAAPSGIELSGGPGPRRGPAVLGARSGTASVVTLTTERPVRPLEPGEVLVLGPTAGPVTEPPLSANAPVEARPLAATRVAPDTVTVSAPSPAPAPAPTTGRTWEAYRTGNVVRISLP